MLMPVYIRTSVVSADN